MRRGFAGVMLLAFVLLLGGCVEQGPGDTNAGPRPLSPPPEFTLEDLNGKNVNLGMLLKEKRLVLVNFWATWCDPCKAEIPDLIELQERHKGEGFTVLGISSGEPLARVASFAKHTGINYPVLLDTEQDVTRLYGVLGVPTSFLYDSEGKLLGTYHIFNEDIPRDVERALAK